MSTELQGGSEAQHSSGSSNPATSGGEQPTFSAEEFRELQTKFQGAQSQIQHLSKTAETVENLRKVFSPEQVQEIDPDDEFLDKYLQWGLENEKSGNPMPYTTNLAVKLYEERKATKALQQQLAEMKAKVDKLDNPQVVADREAYNRIDTVLESTLSQLFDGQPGGYPPQLFNATANMVVQEIQRLQKENPYAWDQIKKSPERQRAMVNHFVEKTVPHKAKELMYKEQVQNTELTPSQLMEAFREAGDIEDPDARRKVREGIRQQLFQNIYEGKRGRSTMGQLSRMR